MTSTNIGCLSRNSIRRHRTRSATNPSSETVIPTITFANRSSAPDSVDPSFQDYLQDQGQTESFLAFRQLEKFDGNIPSVPRAGGLRRKSRTRISFAGFRNLFFCPPNPR